MEKDQDAEETSSHNAHNMDLLRYTALIEAVSMTATLLDCLGDTKTADRLRFLRSDVNTVCYETIPGSPRIAGLGHKLPDNWRVQALGPDPFEHTVHIMGIADKIAELRDRL